MGAYSNTIKILIVLSPVILISSYYFITFKIKLTVVEGVSGPVGTPPNTKKLILKKVGPCDCLKLIDLSISDEFINSTTCSRVSIFNEIAKITGFSG